METKNKLVAKLARILGETGKVEKGGHNEHFRYDYITENDLVYAVRGKLAEAGIFVFSSVESQHVERFETSEGKGTLLTTVTTKHTFVDAESGETFSVFSQGQGSDLGDKGGYKAITGAMKYFLYKCFMIPTGDDPEADLKTDNLTAGGIAPRKTTAQRTTAAPAQTTTERELDEGGHIARETGTVDDRAQFENGAWQKVKIHFGNNYKGMTLGEISPPQLKGWLNWQPKPYNGKISPQDQLLRTALDVAEIETSKE